MTHFLGQNNRAGLCTSVLVFTLRLWPTFRINSYFALSDARSFPMDRPACAKLDPRDSGGGMRGQGAYVGAPSRGFRGSRASFAPFGQKGHYALFDNRNFLTGGLGGICVGVCPPQSAVTAKGSRLADKLYAMMHTY